MKGSLLFECIIMIILSNLINRTLTNMLSFLPFKIEDYPLGTAPEIETLRKIIGETLKEIFNSKNLTLSSQCHQTLLNAYTCIPNTTHPKECINTDISEQFITKLIEDSTKNQNDVTTYSQCMRKYYVRGNDQVKPDPIYLMTIIDKINEETQSLNATNSTHESFWSMFGFCVPRNCSTDEYKEVIYEGVISFWNMLNLNNKNQVTVVNVNNNLSKINWKDPIVYLHLLPAFLILFQFICITFNSLPYFLFKCCKKSYRKESAIYCNNINNNTTLQYYNKNSSGDNDIKGLLGPMENNEREDFHFKYIFNLSENGEEFFDNQLITSINNMSSLSYLTGIRGIAMILMIFGFVFFAMFNSPSSFFLEMGFISMMKSFLFSLFYFGLRYSPKILLSCSGYSLFFKLISFLDDEFDEGKDKRFKTYLEQQKQKQQKVKRKPKQSNYYESNNEGDQSFSSFNDNREINDIGIFSLLKFYLYQLHKYCLFILMILFIQYSLHYIFIICNGINPMWEYFHIFILENKQELSVSKWDSVLKAIALIDPFLFNYANDESFIKYCWLIFCEIHYFLLSTLIIFIGYKYQIRFDRFFLILLLLIFLSKIIFFIIMNYYQKYYSTLYYYFFDYGKIFFGVIWNYIYYLIGITFSTLNYIIQKDISLEELHTKEKQFLIPAATLLGYLKEKKKKTLFIISFCGLLIIILFSLCIPMTLSFSTIEQLRKDHLISMQRSYVLNYIMLIDCEVVVLIVQLSALLFYIKGDNFITTFLSHSGWMKWNKFYFSFILLLNPVILYVLYQSVARVNLTMFNIIIYSFICGILIFVVASAHYIFFELPYKRLIKLNIKKIMSRRKLATN